MNLRKYLSAALLFGSCAGFLNTYAQDETDALRYSFLIPQGTARSMGFGSALGSVGGDFSSLSVNPAGIGVYRKSEFTFTPSFHFGNVEGDYLNTLEDRSKTAFNFSNLGLILTRTERGKRYERSKWKAVSFGIGFNRLADFNRRYSYGGLMKGNDQYSSSFSEIFVADANAYPAGVDDPNTLAFLGYQSYLLGEDSLGFFTLADWTTGLNQRAMVHEKGGIGEVTLSFGGNYEEKLMIGATLGLPSVRYIKSFSFEETDASGDPDNNFDYFIYNQDLKTTGLGVNLKLGLIYRANDYFRLGIAVHTPTWFSMTDEETTYLTANTEQFAGVKTVYNDPKNPEYYLTTPWRGIVSATAFLGQYGFITADYEYVDYQSMRYRFSIDPYGVETVRNQIIKNTYQAASNFRIGIEGRMDNLFARAGFGYYGSPYRANSSNTNRTSISAGLGYRTDRFFADLAYVLTRYSQYEAPYALPYNDVITPVAKLNNSMSNIALTIGFKL